MNRRFKKTLQDTFVSPEAKRKDEFFAEADHLINNSKKKIPVFYRFAAAAVGAAAVFAVGTCLKKSPAPDMDQFREESVIVETTAVVGTSANEPLKTETTVSGSVKIKTAVTESTIVTTAISKEKNTYVSATDASTPSGRNSAAASRTTAIVTGSRVTTGSNSVSGTQTTETVPKPITTTTYNEEEKEMKKQYIHTFASFLSAFAFSASSIPMTSNAASTTMNSPEYEIPAYIHTHLDELDFDNSGSFDNFDVYAMFTSLNEKDSLPDGYADRINAGGDVNHDGKVDNDDYLLVSSYYYWFDDNEFSETAYEDDTYDYGTDDNIEKFYYAVPIEKDEEPGKTFSEFRFYVFSADAESGKIDVDVNLDGNIDLYDYYIYFNYYYAKIWDFLSDSEMEQQFTAEVNKKCKAVESAMWDTGYLPHDARDAFGRYICTHTSDITPEMLYIPYYEEYKTYTFNEASNTAQRFVYDLKDNLKTYCKTEDPKADEPTILDSYDQFDWNEGFHNMLDQLEAECLAGTGIDKVDVNRDGKLNYLDYFDIQVFSYDIMDHKTASESLLPLSTWNFISNNLDFAGNGVSGDWFDIMMVQMLVIKTGDDWCDNVEYELEKYYYKLLKEQKSQQFDTFMADICSKKEAGDVNLDGQITAVDASAVLTYYAKASSDSNDISPVQTKRMNTLGDQNKDGVVDGRDATSILIVYAENSVD